MSNLVVLFGIGLCTASLLSADNHVVLNSTQGVCAISLGLLWAVQARRVAFGKALRLMRLVIECPLLAACGRCPGRSRARIRERYRRRPAEAGSSTKASKLAPKQTSAHGLRYTYLTSSKSFHLVV